MDVRFYAAADNETFQRGRISALGVSVQILTMAHPAPPNTNLSTPPS
jgi:hypothetical protein